MDRRSQSPVRPDLSYMTPYELTLLKDVSYFRLDVCQQCGKYIINSKKFCSKKCYEEYNNLSTKEKLKKILKRKGKVNE